MATEPPSPDELLGKATDSELTALGERKVQEQDGACYLPFPQPFASNEGLEQSTSVDVYRHDPTGAIVYLP